MERLHEGWLVKSPPGKKTIGTWRLFKSKWRQRFFVLYAPPSAQSIPGCCSAVLCYYDDESMTKEYGRIDLNQCEEILTKLESDQYRYVFAVRTLSKDSERTYYLAADTEDAMNEWANCLCCVLRLSGGDGMTLSSGFGHLPSFNDTAFNSSLPRCSILTQKSGEQTRLSNVPDTISKSATALNIRVADLTPTTHATSGGGGTGTGTASKSKSGQHKIGKRQSILNMVIKPASGSARRPSCPTLQLNGFQNKFQTLSHGNMPATPTPRQTHGLGAQSPDNDLHNHQSFLTVGRQTPRFQIDPATPSVGAFDHPTGREHEDRWRFDGRVGATAAGAGDDGQQCPPALPSRVTRNASNVERRDQFRVVNRYRNSMEDSSTSSTWRDSDLQDDGEDSRDPDYDLPKLNYDSEAAPNQQTESDTLQETEASEDDRDDDYSYPHFSYPLLLQQEATETQFRNPLSVVEETEGTNDSYDYLPAYRSSNRTSICRSSVQMSASDNLSFDDRGLYDVLPKRDSSATEGTTGCRMSGIEPGLDDSGCIYQNDVFCRSSSDDIYDYPHLQNPNSTYPDVNSGAEYANGILPPLPEKKAQGRQEVEKVAEKRRVAPLPLPTVSLSEVHNYMNAGDVRMSSYSNSSSQDEGVYLPMACGKTGETIYTPMHSPDGSVFKAVPSESNNCKRNEEKAKSTSLDVQERLSPQYGQSSANDQTAHHGPALIPIRCTANTRSFKRRTPSRAGSSSKEDSLGSSAKHKENREPSAQSNLPPPLPPKTRGSNYVHYAALDLEASTGDRPLSHLSDPPLSPHSGSFHSDTLYRTIDVEKTKALCELKKQMDDRQRNFAKLAPEH